MVGATGSSAGLAESRSRRRDKLARMTYQTTLEIATAGRGTRDITAAVAEVRIDVVAARHRGGAVQHQDIGHMPVLEYRHMILVGMAAATRGY